MLWARIRFVYLPPNFVTVNRKWNCVYVCDIAGVLITTLSLSLFCEVRFKHVDRLGILLSCYSSQRVAQIDSWTTVPPGQLFALVYARKSLTESAAPIWERVKFIHLIKRGNITSFNKSASDRKTKRLKTCFISVKVFLSPSKNFCNIGYFNYNLLEKLLFAVVVQKPSASNLIRNLMIMLHESEPYESRFLPCGSFPWGFLIKILHVFLYVPSMF